MKTPKYDLDQLVFYMLSNRVHSAYITSVMVVENAHDDWAATPEQIEAWQPFGVTGICYATCHGTLEEEQLFSSKEALLASMLVGPTP